MAPNMVQTIIELDDGKIYRKPRKPLYLMVKTVVSCRFSLKPIHWNKIVTQNWMVQKFRHVVISVRSLEVGMVCRTIVVGTSGKIWRWFIIEDATFNNIAQRRSICLDPNRGVYGKSRNWLDLGFMMSLVTSLAFMGNHSGIPGNPRKISCL